MIVSNYGLFWDKHEVDWGWRKHQGTLLGYLEGEKKGEPIDFREQKGIYALYDAAFNLVYIGQAGREHQNLFLRLKQHRTDHLSERWRYFSWFGFCYVLKTKNILSEGAEHPSTSHSEALDHLEAVSVAIAEPKLNLKRGNFNCEKYFQKCKDKDEENV